MLDIVSPRVARNHHSRSAVRQILLNYYFISIQISLLAFLVRLRAISFFKEWLLWNEIWYGIHQCIVRRIGRRVLWIRRMNLCCNGCVGCSHIQQIARGDLSTAVVDQSFPEVDLSCLRCVRNFSVLFDDDLFLSFKQKKRFEWRLCVHF